MGYERTTWIDDDGSLTVGTPFSAAKMNNIEDGILARGAKTALAVDAISQSATFTGSLVTWTHTSNINANSANEYPGLARGMMVIVIQNGTAEDQIESVEFGGQKLKEVKGSPLLHASGAKDGAIHVFFLGDSITQGSATVKVTPKASSTDVKRAVAYTITGDGPIAVQTNTLAQEGEKAGELLPTTGIDVRSGSRALVFAGVLYGVENESEIPIQHGTEDFGHDFGTSIAKWGHLAPEIQGNEVQAFMYWKVTKKEQPYAAFEIAVHVMRDVGVVTSLPATPGIGDKCQYVADEANGIVWDLIYDGIGEYPWKKIGGPALFNMYSGTLSTASATPQTTNAPKITSPLAMEARIGVGTQYQANGTPPGQAWIQPFVNAVGQSNIAINSTAGLLSCYVRCPTIAISNGVAIEARYYAVTTGTASFSNPYIEVDPVRVG